MSTRVRIIITLAVLALMWVAAGYRVRSDSYREARGQRYHDRVEFVRGVRRWWRSTDP